MESIPLNEKYSSPSGERPISVVPAGKDVSGEKRGLGVSNVTFKVVPGDETGILILENTFHAKGGPPRHLHREQDEWFYAVEGEFIIEIGTERFYLKSGDSLLAPRGIPHVWAYVGNGIGRILITFMPAGKMVAFFSKTTSANAMPPSKSGTMACSWNGIDWTTIAIGLMC